MLDSIVVKISVTIYIAFSSVALWLLWHNSVAPDALKNTGLLLASLLPVLIVVFPYLKEEKTSRHFVFDIFYDTQEKSIIGGDKFSAYDSNYMYMFTNLSLVPDALSAKDFSEVMDKKGLDIIEKGIIDSLLLKFMMHWDIETRKFQGPIGNSESASWASKLSSETIQLSEIQNIFKHNHLISKQGVLVHPKLSIPPKSIIKIKNEDKARAFVIENPYSSIEILIRPSMAGVAQQGIWGILASDPNNKNRFFVIEYKVVITFIQRRAKVYAPEMKSYRRWFENICDILQRFDWSTVDSQIESRLNREAISKILNIEGP